MGDSRLTQGSMMHRMLFTALQVCLFVHCFPITANSDKVEATRARAATPGDPRHSQVRVSFFRVVAFCLRTPQDRAVLRRTRRATIGRLRRVGVAAAASWEAWGEARSLDWLKVS